MTREEAIKRLEDTFKAWDIWVKKCPEDAPARLLNEALGMAIAALREQETVTICHHLEPVTIYRTNADHIRSMTDEELAEWIEHITKNPLCYTACARRSSTVPCNGQCCEGVADWLKQPYEEATDD